jgi:polar amino acid transport system substrate-binding protein
MGGGVANAMLHVPADAAPAERVPQVRTTRRYYTETVVARAQRLRNEHTLAVFASEPVGVETASLADAYLLTAFGGRPCEQVRHYTKMREAAAALRSGETAALMGPLRGVEDGLRAARAISSSARCRRPGSR